MARKKKLVTNNTSFLLYIEPDRLETLRRAAYDSCKISLNEAIRECIYLGFALFCEKYGIYPAPPKALPLTEEDLINRKELLRKLVLASKGEL